MSTPDDFPPSVAILKMYYGCVKNLQSYLTSILAVSDNQFDSQELIRSDYDSQSYIDLLKSSYIGAKDFKLLKKFQFSDQLLDMRELLDNAQERIFRERRGKNIITSGYRLASHANDNGKKGMARMGITNYFLNTVITAFQAPEWETLLSR
ncbi:hypothetical protein CVT25_012115 [Psilocybe cyanescens]|uniref:Telomerase reverse transcriptase n=1 Tax=Psilocybe cyanescens TaxID=93625 RepID=A0A409XJ46_PSICY|nr:hypothetical protein CVT25_012115 [Psilocybe cyanescens]